jgi:hypothetical protein
LASNIVLTLAFLGRTLSRPAPDSEERFLDDMRDDL